MKQLERFLKRKSVRQILGDGYVLSGRQAERLLLILDTLRRVKELEDWLPAFAHFIRNDLTNYVGRFRRLKQLPACPSLYNLVLRYGKSEALQRHQVYNRQRALNCSNTVLYWTERGLDIMEAEERVRVIQKDRLDRAVQVVRGSSEYTVRSISHWVRLGYSIADAAEQVRRIQATNGIASYQRRGHIDPAKAQHDRNEKWLASLNAKDADERRRINLARSHSIEGCLARGLEQSEAEATSIAYFAKRRNFSRISQVCFNMVRDLIGVDGLYYKELNYEKQLNGKNVDFFDSNSGIVIEFLGDFWHANPLSYRGLDLIYRQPACNVWLDDKRRFSRIECHSSVSRLLIVWESEFRQNPTEVASFIVEALLESRNAYV